MYSEIDSREPKFEAIQEHIQNIVHSEMNLMSGELEEKVEQVKKGSHKYSVGFLLCFLSMQTLVFVCIYAASSFMEIWAAALILSFILALLGVIAIRSARKDLLLKNLKFKRSMRTMKDNFDVLKEKLQ